MTASGQRTRAENVAAPRPSRGQGQAKINATTPLPDGWASFCSRPDSNNISHWYATSPYPVEALRGELGSAALELAPTVDAPTWPKLHMAVAAQIRLYEALTSKESA